jgi:hypothetical protein
MFQFDRGRKFKNRLHLARDKTGDDQGANINHLILVDSKWDRDRPRDVCVRVACPSVITRFSLARSKKLELVRQRNVDEVSTTGSGSSWRRRQLAHYMAPMALSVCSCMLCACEYVCFQLIKVRRRVAAGCGRRHW